MKPELVPGTANVTGIGAASRARHGGGDHLMAEGGDLRTCRAAGGEACNNSGDGDGQDGSANNEFHN